MSAITELDARQVVRALREYANTEMPAWHHATAIDPQDVVEECEHCQLHAIADRMEASILALGDKPKAGRFLIRNASPPFQCHCSEHGTTSEPCACWNQDTWTMR